MSYRASIRLPLAITMSMPASRASRAAWSLVAMPPVPRQVPAPPAMASSSGVTASTWWISFASGWVRGSAS